MTTRKKLSSATARIGVNFARDIVERANCVFQEIDQHNDLGNDAYIEFVCAEEATGSCIAAQVKSGESYVKSDGSFVLKADRAHFEYWKNHSLPICGIIYDPVTDRATWCDITNYLESNPQVIDSGPYQIPIAADRIFDETTFAAFREHFKKYKTRYSSDTHFGNSIERFSPYYDAETRLDALMALFSFHRNKAATWCYIASLFRTIEESLLLNQIIRALTLIPGHGDIWWNDKNHIDEVAKSKALKFMKATFGRDEVIKLLSAVDENGFERGTIGQAIHAIIDIIQGTEEVLHEVAFNSNIAENVRYSALWLLIYYAQEESTQLALSTINEFRNKFPNNPQDGIFVEAINILNEFGCIAFY